MQLETRTLRKSINKAFLKETVDRSDFNHFKAALRQLLNNIESAEEKDEHEEHFKNFLVPFLNEVGFKEYYINTSLHIDLAIHTDSKVKDPVGVLMEVKRPSNKNEMISESNVNRKALHEAALYYLEQRLEEENTDLKHVIVTDMLNWFVFDAQEFERCFYKPSHLRKVYKSWKADQKVSSNKDFMYDEIARFIDGQETTVRGLHLNLKEYAKLLEAKEGSEHEKKLIPLYKFFSPIHLLKEPFANDSNTLNREFYRELLYILGLEEIKDGSTRYIERAGEDNRQSGSLVENTIRILDAEDHLSAVSEPKVRYGQNREDQFFNVALELSITWMNRILFLKLLEAQLFRYHRQDKKFKFLNHKTIDGFDELNKLFFQVLARRESERTEDVNATFGHIPYLNSSLFDPTALEHETVFISNLDDKKTLPVYNRSVLTDQRGEEKNIIQYLFEFLDAYDFAAEGGEEIQQERKTLINASVLGLIFEKINGYKDGSFFTPGFITEYMARETLRRAVADKFAKVLAPSGPHPNPSPASDPPSTSVLLSRGRRMSEGQDEGETTPGTAKNQGTKHDKGNHRGMSGEPGKKLPDALIAAARELRQEQTEAKELLWQLLRNRQLNGYKFRRQHPIKEGIILDFYCHKARLAVEVDGGYHDTEEQQAADEERTELLNKMGIHVIRFRNEEVLEDTKSVLAKIADVLDRRNSPLSEGERTDEGELSFTDIYNAIGREISIEKANEIVNSITICDPAVGSGHFLVSCLNELLAIKSDLGILCDREGKLLHHVNIEIENDELIVTWGDEELFEYDVRHTWHGNQLADRKIASDRQRIQKALFHEKRHIIENCLFGVDINPNSVKICRLRLWIELLKNTYYTERSDYRELEVLPNIDINIKTGNSLVSRFELDSDLGSVFKDSEHSLDDYKEAVRNYKHSGDRAEKQRLQKLIDDIKEEYSTTLSNNRPINKKLSRQRGRLELMQNADLFGEQKFSKKEIKKQEKKVKKLEEQKAEEESGAFYNQAFEWRFEFPEVLDEEGRFTGFDVVIGNPPYGVKFSKEEKDYLKSRFDTIVGKYDSYGFFIEAGVKLIKNLGLLGYIVPHTWLTVLEAKSLRQYLLNQTRLIEFIKLPSKVFDEAIVETVNIILQKEDKRFNRKENVIKALLFDENQEVKEIGDSEAEIHTYKQSAWDKSLIFNIYLSEKEQNLLDKINKDAIGFSEICDFSVGIQAYDKYTGQEPEVIKERKFHSDKKVDETFVKELNGRDIKRYSYKWPGESWISYGDWLAHPRQKKYFDQPRVLVREITNSGEYKINACYAEEYLINYKSILNIILENDARKAGYDIFFILGLVNSKLISWYFPRASNKLVTSTFPRISIYDLKQFPIPATTLDSKKKKKIHDKISELSKKVSGLKMDNPDANTSELEAEIDRLVYELYELSEEEIEIVEESVGD